jgi:hypothetical protein
MPTAEQQAVIRMWYDLAGPPVLRAGRPAHLFVQKVRGFPDT